MTFSAAWLASQPPSVRERVIRSLTAAEAERLPYEWRFWARPEQLAPDGDWRTWLALAGRGWGKTRTGAEWIREEVEAGRRGRLALVGPTAPDVRDVMIEGESGLLRVSPPWFRPTYEPSKRRLTWPNGAIATAYSAEEPDRLRGPQHDGGWADELAAWQYPEAWDQLQFGLRLGVDPRVVVTTTPRPTPAIKALVDDKLTVVRRGSTFENRGNLAGAFLREILRKYQGTRLGRQELYAEILEDVEGALWTRALIERHRRGADQEPRWLRIVVAVDPAVTASETSDETGIVVVGLGADGHAYVIADYSGRHTPDTWAKRVVKAFDDWRADRIVAESNNGGQLVAVNIATVRKNLPLTLVHASQGKRTRAEPIAALYEQGKVHHIGAFPKLEDQMTTWEPLTGARSPDRLDAMVWGVTELMFTPQVRRGLSLLDA